MKIEISVQEYFNELKLMEKHYGQEEDLYPWIYMLLQMAEEKKQDILKDWYSKVSIRDVHNGQYYSWKARDEDNWKIRWELYKNVGVPDFAIICNNKVVGCVEVKMLEENLFENKPEEECEYTLETDCEKLVCILKEENVKKFLEDLETDPECGGNQIKSSLKKTNNWEVHIIEVNSDKVETILKKYAGSVKPSIYVEYEENPLSGEEKNQVLGHLVKFGKVIYTNGLEFYLLTVETISKTKNNKTQYKINVTELANLTNSYENYKSGKANASTILEAAAEWDKLIAGLTKINWLAKPTTLISEDSK
ncbi:MAG: hypothetical protein PUB46_08505 [Lachnospiraceae bacterium]|nr:hypothetical protein [Lachnospiraceae bacterium]